MRLESIKRYLASMTWKNFLYLSQRLSRNALIAALLALSACSNVQRELQITHAQKDPTPQITKGIVLPLPQVPNLRPETFEVLTANKDALEKLEGVKCNEVPAELPDNWKLTCTFEQNAFAVYYVTTQQYEAMSLNRADVTAWMGAALWQLGYYRKTLSPNESDSTDQD